MKIQDEKDIKQIVTTEEIIAKVISFKDPSNFVEWYCDITHNGSNVNTVNAFDIWAKYRNEYHNSISEDANIQQKIKNLRDHMNSISKIASELRIYIVGNHRQASNLAVIEEAIGEIIYSETHEVAYDGRETVLKRNKFNNSVSKFTKFKPTYKSPTLETYPKIAQRLEIESKKTPLILGKFSIKSKFIFYKLFSDEIFREAGVDYPPTEQDAIKEEKDRQILSKGYKILTIPIFRIKVVIPPKWEKSAYDYTCDDGKTSAYVYGGPNGESLEIGYTILTLKESYNKHIHIEKEWDTIEKKNQKYTLLRSSLASDRYTIKALYLVKNFESEGIKKKNRQTIEIHKGIIHPETGLVITMTFSAEEKYATQEFYKKYELIDKYIEFF